jgi:hypothetical protein
MKGMMSRSMRQSASSAGPGGTGAVTRLWRRRSEIILLAGAASLGLAAFRMHAWWGFGIVTGMAAAPVTLKRGRSILKAHFLCVYSRHRLQQVFLNTYLRTRSGRIPLILWITPTPEGEKALVLCRVGTSAGLIQMFGGEIAAACGAMDARVARHRKWSNLVTIEIVRRVAYPMRPPAGVSSLMSSPYSWEPLGKPQREPSPDIAEQSGDRSRGRQGDQRSDRQDHRPSGRPSDRPRGHPNGHPSDRPNDGPNVRASDWSSDLPEDMFAKR